MNLLELRRKYPMLFYAQSWFDGESFMCVLPNERRHVVPTVTRQGVIPTDDDNLPLAVDLVTAYVRYPEADVWRGYLWCRDTDALGQRVYLGGTANGHGLEIHRHLHITERWGVPVWP